MRFPDSRRFPAFLEPHHRPLISAAGAAFFALPLLNRLLHSPPRFAAVWMVPSIVCAAAAITLSRGISQTAGCSGDDCLQPLPPPEGEQPHSALIRPGSLLLLALALGWFVGGSAALRLDHAGALSRPRLSLPAQRGGSLTVEGVLLTDSLPGRGEAERYRMRVDSLLSPAGEGSSASGEVELLVSGGARGVAGSGISVTLDKGELEALASGRGVVRLRAAEVALTPPTGMLEAIRGDLRSALERRLRRLGSEPGALARALLLGDRSALDPALPELIRRSGGTHLLALSGMHLALIAMLLSALLSPLLGRLGMVVVTALLGVYFWLVGPIPSLLRALLMFGLAAALRLRGRRSDPKSLLAAALLIALLLAPTLAESLGWRLSTLALAGILWIGVPLQRLVPRIPGARIARGVMISASALIATTPLTLRVFSEAYPVSLVSSLLLTPLILLSLLLVLLSLPALQLLPGLTLPVRLAADLLYRLIEETAGFFARAAPLTGATGTAVWALLALLTAVAILAPWLRLARRSIGVRRV
ncbi:MAG: ComEC/Rec2 family competence protein [Alkalispirochaetaceae bacterium]